jgi:hypothetical protein
MDATFRRLYWSDNGMAISLNRGFSTGRVAVQGVCMLHIKRARQRVLSQWLAVVAGLLLVSGCASTLSARVTSFQKWPADAQGASYRIVPGAGQENNLEFQNIADMIRANIGPVGLVEASAQGGKASASPRFDVHVQYSNPSSQVWVRRYADPYLYDGWGFGPAFGWYGGYPFWGGAYYSPAVVDEPVLVYRNTLTFTINDNRDKGLEVYRSTAVNQSGRDNLLQAMPYLARAVFDGFPGNNGQVREVEYERGR